MIEIASKHGVNADNPGPRDGGESVGKWTA